MVLRAVSKGEVKRRRVPWEVIIAFILLGVAVALIAYAFMPPAPPPYIR